jgi:hypothetical protein
MPGTMKKKPTGGLKKLPTAVRNKMGYMNKGGVAKKKVIKAGVGKPYISGTAPGEGKGTKVQTLQNAIAAIWNSNKTMAQKRKMSDSVLKAQKEQIKNKTYTTKKKKK